GRYPAFDPRSKVPHQTWLVEIDGPECHFRPQIFTRLSVKLRGRKKSRDCRRGEESYDEIDRRGGDRTAFQKLRVIDHVACEQKRKQRKRGQGVMRQFGFD